MKIDVCFFHFYVGERNFWLFENTIVFWLAEDLTRLQVVALFYYAQKNETKDTHPIFIFIINMTEDRSKTFIF